MAFSKSQWDSLISEDRFREALADTESLDQAEAVIHFGLEIIGEKSGSTT